MNATQDRIIATAKQAIEQAITTLAALPARLSEWLSPGKAVPNSADESIRRHILLGGVWGVR